MIQYEGRLFRSMTNSDGGDVSGETTFHYHQRGDVVWATYSGGSVLFGTLLAKVDAVGNLATRYQHLSVEGKFKSGHCQSRPEVLPDGRLRLHESWQWTDGAEGEGVSVIEEIEGVVTLRAAVADDVAFLTDCFLRGMKESITASRGTWDEGRERQQFEFQLELPLTQVIVRDGVAVGFVVIVPETQNLRIFTLCIAPEQQGSGVGSEVIRRVVADARARGCGAVLSVLKPNVRAQALYERLGFRVVGESERHRHLRHAQLQSRAG